MFVCTFALDRIYVRLQKANNGIANPEFRMPLLIACSLLLPIAVVMYGWAADRHWPVAILLVSTGLLGFCLSIGMIPLSTYVVDAFGDYSASALTAVLIARCLMSTFLPLAVTPLVDRLGWGFGFLTLAAICLVVAPIPVIVMRYGSRLRQHSSYTKNA